MKPVGVQCHPKTPSSRKPSLTSLSSARDLVRLDR
jgi:hypothetical protein